MSTLTLPAVGSRDPSDRAPHASAQPPASGTSRTLDSRALLGGSTTVQIDHQGEVYTLRRTRLGKLILTK